MNESLMQVKSGGEGTAKIVYLLYLASIVFGITGIIGVVMAYINKSDAPDWLNSHYQFQIRTFWIGFFYMCIGILFTFVLVGYLVFLFCTVWLVIRCVKGMKCLDQRREYPNPTTWLF